MTAWEYAYLHVVAAQANIKDDPERRFGTRKIYIFEDVNGLRLLEDCVDEAHLKVINLLGADGWYMEVGHGTARDIQNLPTIDPALEAVAKQVAGVISVGPPATVLFRRAVGPS